eukprot:TRINITY_DN5176_c1_g1_i1.p1 TRINITY_DN5176_c1_g1~~TRINITY_DN5176_c1_g1_i1.p1  ORF type:complete len:437 (-),score=176.41 TRINITY_DN5176_c1_g1_i1:115-1425(-)
MMEEESRSPSNSLEFTQRDLELLQHLRSIEEKSLSRSTERLSKKRRQLERLDALLQDDSNEESGVIGGTTGKEEPKDGSRETKEKKERSGSIHDLEFSLRTKEAELGRLKSLLKESGTVLRKEDSTSFEKLILVQKELEILRRVYDDGLEQSSDMEGSIRILRTQLGSLTSQLDQLVEEEAKIRSETDYKLERLRVLRYELEHRPEAAFLLQENEKEESEEEDNGEGEERETKRAAGGPPAVKDTAWVLITEIPGIVDDIVGEHVPPQFTLENVERMGSSSMSPTSPSGSKEYSHLDTPTRGQASSSRSDEAPHVLPSLQPSQSISQEGDGEGAISLIDLAAMSVEDVLDDSDARDHEGHGEDEEAEQKVIQVDQKGGGDDDDDNDDNDDERDGVQEEEEKEDKEKKNPVYEDTLKDLRLRMGHIQSRRSRTSRFR